MVKRYDWLLAAFLLFSSASVWSQAGHGYTRCATMDLLENAFQKDPSLRTSFIKKEALLQQALRLKATQPGILRVDAIVEVPIVFHIVLTNPNIVTDAQVLAQLDTLNKDFAGENGDSVKIPAAFKSLYGKSGIRFVLAQRTPNDEPTEGIVRYTAGKTSYSSTDTTLKNTSKGGADAWDPDRYFNVWICNLGNGILGYGTFPGQGSPTQQGVAILYSSLPGGTAAPYNRGRTLTHEAGHFFNLFHIWGDDGGGCSGSDNVDDTPNQATSTGGCPDGIVITDACTATAPGIMYQNFMDYTDDACMLMFTSQQGTRMETALQLYRSSLITSNGAEPVILFTLDASLKSIDQPAQRVCSPSVSPMVTLRNKGVEIITSADIYVSVDGGAPSVTHWTGSLPSLTNTTVSLGTITIGEGKHILKIYVSDPNGSVDPDGTNDTLTNVFEYYAPVTPPLTEGFEGSTFPPTGWDIVNPDGYYTWQRVTGIAKTGNASVVMRNLDYEQNGPKDYLRLPEVNIANADSAFLTFQVAAAVQTNPSTSGNVWDTLEVLISTDCGNTYTSLYKKWGASLITRSTAVTSNFVPASNEWRKDSVNLTPYINAGPVMLAFLNTTQYENNIYLDDIGLYQVSINPNLKAKGVMVTPSPTSGTVLVQLYPNPTNLRGITIYNSSGQQVLKKIITGAGSNYYSFDISGYNSGLYYVQVVFADRTVTKKILKVN